MLTLTLSLLTVITAGKFAVVAPDADSAAAVISVCAGDAGVGCVDAREVYALLTSDETRKIGSSKAGPPKALPVSLARAWKQAAVACSERYSTDEKKRGRYSSNAVSLCGYEASEWLWEGFLKSEGYVGYVQVENSTRGKAVVVSVTQYLLGASAAKSTALSTDDAKRISATGECAARVFGGDGGRGGRDVTTQMALGTGAPIAQKWTITPAEISKLAAVPVPPGCAVAKLPAKLKVTPGDSLGRALESRWALSVGKDAKGPALSCKFVASSGELKSMTLGDAKTVRVNLLCGGFRASNVTAPDISRGDPVELHSRNLLTQLLEDHCLP